MKIKYQVNGPSKRRLVSKTIFSPFEWPPVAPWSHQKHKAPPPNRRRRHNPPPQANFLSNRVFSVSPSAKSTPATDCLGGITTRQPIRPSFAQLLNLGIGFVRSRARRPSFEEIKTEDNELKVLPLTRRRNGFLGFLAPTVEGGRFPHVLPIFYTRRRNFLGGGRFWIFPAIHGVTAGRFIVTARKWGEVLHWNGVVKLQVERAALFLPQETCTLQFFSDFSTFKEASSIYSSSSYTKAYMVVLPILISF